MQKSKKIYLDNASATPLDPLVFSVMQKVLKKNYANAGSIYELGVESKKILDDSRETVAKIIGAHNDEIIFTSGATESNNLAILGITFTYFKKQKFLPHIITTNIEHPSVLEVCRDLEKTGQAEVTFVSVEANGIVDPKKIKKAIKPNTVLISVMYANNEIGTIQPIREIAKEIRHFRKNNGTVLPIFHIDATQAINYLPVEVEKLGIDLMSFNAGKIYGPKGVGVLYIKRKTLINKIMFGGEQEFGLRPGTENISSAVGLAEALKITEKIKEKEVKRLLKLRDYFIEKVLKLDSAIVINGDLTERLPNNINLSFPKIPSDLLVLEFSARGVYVSERSACKSGEKAGSYVIKAIREAQGSKEANYNSLRFSLGRQSTKADIDYTLKSFSQILNKLKKWYT